MEFVNPFRPSFGSEPPALVGRRPYLDDARLGIVEGPGSPLRALALSGPRGVGKTVLLHALRQSALAQGWLQVGVTAGDSMMQDIIDQTLAASAHLVDRPAKRAVTAVGAAGFSVTTTLRPVPDVGTRTRIEQILSDLAEHGTGLYLTIDEVHKSARGLADFCKALQHFVSEGRPIAVAFAGLPHHVREMSTAPGMTFIWRAERILLGEVPLADVRDSFAKVISAAGRCAPGEVVDAMASATFGYPYLIQLVGYHTWRQSGAPHIRIDDVAAGVAAARRRVETSVLAYAIGDLSGKERDFLDAMLSDQGRPSKLADISARLGVTTGYASVYRSRLIESGVVRPVSHGYLEFALPYLGDYLRAQLG